jgi:ABC-2 type transport system permease protein
MTQREFRRFLRQPSRIIGALVPPLVFWFLIGSGLGSTFKPADAPADLTAFAYLFPGTLLLIALFTAVFSTISVIEDRREGFMQGVLVAPVSRVGVVLGKVLGGTLLALAQVVLVLVLAPFFGASFSASGLLLAVAIVFVTAFGFTGLGFWLAWRMDTTQGFHAIMNLFLFPMWILSGALFPATGAPGWLRAAMAVNPASHALDALRQALHAGSGAVWGTQSASIGVPLTVSVAFSLLMFGVATKTAQRTRIPGGWS